MMKKYCGVLLSAVGLSGMLGAHKGILKQVRENHFVQYDKASQLTKQDLGSLFLAQDAQDSRRIQIKSVDQGATGSDVELRGSSCGYHALRNGILCADALINKDGTRASLKKISSQGHANELFGTKQAPWRLIIGKMRNEATAKRVCRERIFNTLTLKKEGPDREFDLLMRCAGDIHLPILARPAIWEDGYHYPISRRDVHKALIDRSEVIAQHGKSDVQGAAKALKNRSILDSYFQGDLSMEFVIDFEGQCYFAESPDLIIAQVPGIKYGNWVQSDEMPTLIDTQRSEGLLETEPSLLVATYGEDQGGVDQHAFASEKFMQLYALIRETKDDCVGVVLTYLPGCSSKGSHEGSWIGRAASWFGSWFSAVKRGTFAQDAQAIQSVEDNGHWVTLVVSRIKGTVFYYILDSLGNGKKLRNSRINEIIDIFDGKKSLPGYSWTARQVEKQCGNHSASGAQRSAEVKQGYSWTKIGVGTLASGLLAYAAYTLYQDRQKKKNP